MNALALSEFGKKLYLTVKDVAQILAIKPESARVACARYARQGMFIRLKNDFYVLGQKWESYSRKDFFRLANHLQVPSYISFGTALAHYELTTQVPGVFFESAALKRSRRLNIRNAAFNYYKLKKSYYFDFVKEEGVFIATREKAFVDAIFLLSLGKYSLDIDSLDMAKLNKNRINKIAGAFPVKTQRMVRQICGN